MAITIVYLDSEDMEKLNHGEKVVIDMNSRIQNSNELWIRTKQEIKKKHFILVGTTSWEDAKAEFNCCRYEFERRGVYIHACSFVNTTIETDNCYIRFVNYMYPNSIRGMKVDICFGFPEELQCCLNTSGKPTDYDGIFLDYVYEVEGIKE